MSAPSREELRERVEAEALAEITTCFPMEDDDLHEACAGLVADRVLALLEAEEPEPVAWRRWEESKYGEGWIYYETQAWPDAEPLYASLPPAATPIAWGYAVRSSIRGEHLPTFPSREEAEAKRTKDTKSFPADELGPVVALWASPPPAAPVDGVLYDCAACGVVEGCDDDECCLDCGHDVFPVGAAPVASPGYVVVYHGGSNYRDVYNGMIWDLLEDAQAVADTMNEGHGTTNYTVEPVGAAPADGDECRDKEAFDAGMSSGTYDAHTKLAHITGLMYGEGYDHRTLRAVERFVIGGEPVEPVGAAPVESEAREAVACPSCCCGIHSLATVVSMCCPVHGLIRPQRPQEVDMKPLDWEIGQ